MASAKVYDIAPAHLRRTLEVQQAGVRASSIVDDLADGVEAVHQLSNLAGFSERPRAFVFALATAAHKTGGDFVELFDEVLAELQGCSTRTVRRQRKDYLKESRARRFGFVEVIEGDYDKGANQNAPTKYRFHVGDQIAEAVELARQAPGWAEMKRQQQREAIARACQEVFHTIPDARRQGRKRPRPRPATAEIETCQKVVETKLQKLRARAETLPPDDHERLMDDPGELRAWWLKTRAEMDKFFGLHSPETSGLIKVDEGAGQFVRTPSRLSAPAERQHEPSVRDVAAWEALERRAAGAPRVVTRAVNLHTPPTEEELEAEAIRAEGCRAVPP